MMRKSRYNGRLQAEGDCFRRRRRRRRRTLATVKRAEQSTKCI